MSLWQHFYSHKLLRQLSGHDLFANLSAAWRLGQLLALYSRLAPAITNAWCCQKQSSRILETKFLAFPQALTLVSLQGWFGVGSNTSMFSRPTVWLLIMYDGFMIGSILSMLFGMPASQFTQAIGCRQKRKATTHDYAWLRMTTDSSEQNKGPNFHSAHCRRIVWFLSL